MIKKKNEPKKAKTKLVRINECPRCDTIHAHVGDQIIDLGYESFEASSLAEALGASVEKTYLDCDACKDTCTGECPHCCNH